MGLIEGLKHRGTEDTEFMALGLCALCDSVFPKTMVELSKAKVEA